MKGAGGLRSNTLSIRPRTRSGEVAEYVRPADIRLLLSDSTGTLVDVAVSTVSRSLADDHGLRVSYSVPGDCANTLTLRVFVCDVMIGGDHAITAGYDALGGNDVKRIINIPELSRFGLAVNSARTRMAVMPQKNEIHVYQLVPTLEQLCMIIQPRRKGIFVHELNCPRRLCFTARGTMLVCDFSNSAVHQWTLAGKCMNEFPTKTRAFSVAAHGNMCAVGCVSGRIQMHNYVSGKLLRTFGAAGDGPGLIGGHATGIRFASHGACLLIAEHCNNQLSLFTIDGLFIKHIGVGVLSSGENDVAYGAGGEIIVADCSNHRVCVFSPDGDTLIRSLDIRFSFPTSLAVAGTTLYVLDEHGIFLVE